MAQKDQGVKAKKSLGQHFLADKNVARDIVDSIQFYPGRKVLEVGPGTGVLTDFLLKKDFDFRVVEIDRESIALLEKKYPELEIIQADFLRINLSEILNSEGAVIGNFPYNISTQILFHCIEYKDVVSEIVGMFQKEVAERIVSVHGKKSYGIISVLIQTYYDCEYLFTVEPEVFIPPPKVRSAVIRLVRKKDVVLPVSEHWYKLVIKTAFNQRRKTLKNALSSLIKQKNAAHHLLSKRAEQLSLEDFGTLASWLQNQ